MTGRHWIRKDVLFPLVLLAAFGYGIHWIWQKMKEQPTLQENRLFYVAFIVGLIIYALLALITIRHAISSYALERFNPGNPQSLRRLRRLLRFRLPRRLQVRLRQWVDPAGDLGQWLQSMGYHANARTPHGRVFVKPRKLLFSVRPTPVDRVFVLQHDLLNVLMIDQLFKDSIRYIRQQNDQPSPRNLLILIMSRTDDNEAISAAAGVVNFLGKFNGGTLGVLLLDRMHNRLFYPVDRSLQPRLHRRYQDLLRLRLIHWLRTSPAMVRRSAVIADPTISADSKSGIRRFTPEPESLSKSGIVSQVEPLKRTDETTKAKPMSRTGKSIKEEPEYEDDFVFHLDEENPDRDPKHGT